MASVLRRIVILMATLGFIVTSVGWGVAGALVGFEISHDGAMTSAAVETDDHHIDRAAEQASPCSQPDDCGEKSGHQELADSCCGSTCHIVTQASACDQILVPMARALEGVSPEDDITEAAPARLERPPRSLIG